MCPRYDILVIKDFNDIIGYCMLTLDVDSCCRRNPFEVAICISLREWYDSVIWPLIVPLRATKPRQRN